MNKINKILFLGYEQSKIIDFLNNEGLDLITRPPIESLSLNEITDIDPDLIISYGYKKIVSKEIIKSYKDKILNLHISSLPWNRGMHPNFWSILEDTPKGTTIHFMDEGVDTGDIIFQANISFSEKEDTLKKTYFRLRDELEFLFIKNWNNFLNGKFIRKKQELNEGSFHYSYELQDYWEKMPLGWDTKISDVERLLC